MEKNRYWFLEGLGDAKGHSQPSGTRAGLRARVAWVLLPRHVPQAGAKRARELGAMPAEPPLPRSDSALMI